MEDLQDRIAYALARAFIFFFERIPLAAGLFLGDLIGRVVFYCSSGRRIAYINLKKLFFSLVFWLTNVFLVVGSWFSFGENYQ